MPLQIKSQVTLSGSEQMIKKLILSKFYLSKYLKYQIGRVSLVGFYFPEWCDQWNTFIHRRTLYHSPGQLHLYFLSVVQGGHHSKASSSIADAFLGWTPMSDSLLTQIFPDCPTPCLHCIIPSRNMLPKHACLHSHQRLIAECLSTVLSTTQFF